MEILMIRSRDVAFADDSLLRVNEQDVFTDVFPQELILEIFSNLHFLEILRVATLNKKVSVLVNDPGLLKFVIYRNMTFNPQDWKHYFGAQNPAAFDDEFAWKSLPNNIGEIYKNQFLRFPKKRLGETHVIVWKPANLSINHYESLLKTKKEFKFSVVDVQKIGDDLTEKAEWLVMTRKIIPGSLVQYYPNHERLIKKQKLHNFTSCTIPKVIEAMICSASIFLKFGVKTLYIQNMTRCLETDHLPFGVCFSKELIVCSRFFIQKMGVAPIWKF